MRYPLTSFSTSILFWIIVFAILSWLVFAANHQVQKVVDVDANLIVSEKSVVKNNPKPALEKAEKSIDKAAPVTNKNTSSQEQSAVPTARPLPKIPDDLREEAFQSFAVARFHIAADGSFNVELIKPCNNPKLNFLLLNSLKKWQFAPEKHLGIFVATTKDIKVEFKVE